LGDKFAAEGFFQDGLAEGIRFGFVGFLFLLVIVTPLSQDGLPVV
jgi:hypothetical protein